MTRRSRFFLLGMSGAFGTCIGGLFAGMVYSLYESLLRHRDLWTVLSGSIPYYRMLGAIGILGFILFFVFLLSIASEKNHSKPIR